MDGVLRSTMPPQDRHDIKALIGKRGLTLADVGRLCEPPVTRQAISQVLTAETRSYRIEAALAVATGLTLAEVQQVTRSVRSSAERPDVRPDSRNRAGAQISKVAA